MTILAWCLKNWKIFAYALAAILIISLLGVIKHWQHNSSLLPALREEVLQEKRRTAEEKKKSEEREQSLRKELMESQAASKRYQDELEANKSIPTPSNTVIRVCRPAVMPRPTASPPIAAGSSEGTAATGVLQDALEFDTRPLFGDAERADELSAQVRQLLDRCR